ncbi:50S ribosomal protein L23 [bacterium BMS3Abin02]|nr:50S ribosomal protein L23 [Actinomycetota bacterium]GBD85174.1 50S ribosomal protein L23 [bacterium BMS3Abin02]GBE21256.1 50S ribosomal protein L23 [bacterium BMS3Bbin01]HDH25838.1 50S ribosomal protein L23 [Actinomycetota bacterium]HDL48770.1 50S ribosomal protein L23 [Actinomycetota bacterium]
MKDPRDVILTPVVSEKSYDLIEQHNTYTFDVVRSANRTEIAKAIAEIFDVTVLRVNTLNRRGKQKRTGWVVGRRQDTKRALVKLAPGATIDIFGV